MTPHEKQLLNPDQLNPGDILLCSTTDQLSKLIQEVDQGGYSHTILYVGKTDGHHMIVHATTKGVLHQKLTHIIDNEEIDLLDAYRFYDDNGNSPGSPALPVEPIIENALSYVDGPYFWSELLMGGLVILSVDQFKSKTMQKIVRILGGLVESKIVKLFEKKKGKKAMVCVQVATTSYWNADTSPARKLGIKIEIAGNRKHVPIFDDDHGLINLKKKLQRDFDVYNAIPTDKLISEDPIILKAGSPFIPLGTCTLRDMSHSPSLKLLGSIKNTRKV